MPQHWQFVRQQNMSKEKPLQSYWPKYLNHIRLIIGICAIALMALGIKNWISIDYSTANKAMHPEFLPMHVPVAASALLTYLAIGLCGILTLLGFKKNCRHWALISITRGCLSFCYFNHRRYLGQSDLASLVDMGR